MGSTSETMTRQPALRSEAAEPLPTSPKARDHRDLAGHHDVGTAADAVDQALAAAVEVVELRLGDAVVDVDRGEEELALLLHDVEAMDARRRLLGHALDGLADAAVPAMVLGEARLDGFEENLFLLIGRALEEGHVAAFGADAEVDQQRGVAAVIEDHVRCAAIGPFEDAVGVVPIVREALALDGEHRRAGGRDGGGGVVLRRIDVARGPAHVGAERLQRLDQHAGLDGHVQRAGDPRALERLARPVLGPRRHQAGHLGLGDGEFLAAPLGELEIGDDEIVVGGGWHAACPCCDPGAAPTSVGSSLQ